MRLRTALFPLVAMAAIACHTKGGDAVTDESADSDTQIHVNHDDNNSDNSDKSDGNTDNGDDTDVASGDYDGAALATQYANAYCNYRAACQPIFTSYLPQTKAECKTAVAASMTPQWTAVAPLIDQHQVTFHRGAFDDCIADFANAIADCDVGPTPDACSYVFDGPTADGDGCTVSDECASGSWCAGATPDACGTCAPEAEVSDDCSATPCTPGLTCAAVGDEQLCVPNTANIDDACGTVDLGLCRGALVCGSSATCERPAELNDACSSGGAADTGDTASPPSDAPDCNIFAGVGCDHGTCVAVNVVGASESCGAAFPINLCASDTYCDTAQQVCVPLVAVDHACSNAKPCASGEWCKFASGSATTGTCKAQFATGHNCTDSVQCDGNNVCIGGSCGALVYDDTCQ